MLPSILAKQLEKGIGDYIETTFPMTNEPFRGSVRNMLETKDSVYHEPYVSVRLPFRVAEKMPDCFEAIHPAYLPYVHQDTAFQEQVPVRQSVSYILFWNIVINIGAKMALRHSLFIR